MNDGFIKNIEEFRRRAESLHKEGLKKKEIAQYLGIHSPVYSTITTFIVDELLALKNANSLNDSSISSVFSQVNNISEKKLRKNIESFNQKLKKLEKGQYETKKSPFRRFKNLIYNPSNEQFSSFEGVFDFFYISTSGYRVKKEPMMIKYETDNYFKVYKGNLRSDNFYVGFGYMSNQEAFTMQLTEEKTPHPDLCCIHMFLPYYAAKRKLFRGISMGMSSSYHPISRKVILRKQSDVINEKDYHQLKTSYFDTKENLEESDSVIYDYLTQSNSLLECLPVPRQSFTESDLIHEVKISEMLDG